MNSTKVVIVDDEAPARERLRRMLSKIEGIEVIGEAEDGLQAIEQIERLQPDLALLDIQMPGLDGFGVLDALQKPPPIIFVTAYDAYALRAFEVSALDYLLKPYSQDRLEAAVHRARTTTFSKGALAQRSGSLFESLVEQGRYLTRLAVQDREKIRLLDVSEIDWIGIEQGVLMAHTGEAAYATRSTLDNLEVRLDPEHFFRAHRSVIVNLDQIQEIIPWFKSSYKLRLNTGVELDLSRARARELRKRFPW
ncbi:MAG TPA: response regulator transcription factor [Anaerolineae bacterium]|nr:response regulator transcription factor [Anaerolineae bacterium]